MGKFYKLCIQKLKDFNLRKKLLLSFLFMSIIPIVTIGTVSYLKSSDIIIDQTKRHASLTIEQISKDMDAYVDKIERITYTIYSNIELQRILESNPQLSLADQLDNREIIQQLLLGIKIIDPNIDGVYLYTKDKNLFCENNSECNTGLEEYNFEQEEWYSDILNKDLKAALIPLHDEKKYKSKQANKNFSYVRTLIDIYNGQYLGFLLVDIDGKVIEDIVGHTGSKIQGRILIVDNNNKVMYDSYKKICGDTIILDSETSIDKENIIMTHESSKTGWSVIFLTPISELKREVNEIKKFTAVIAIICASILLFISSIISSSISYPLNELKEAIEIVENGNLDVEVDIMNNDEIGQLSSSFNKMIKNIKTLIEKVYQSQLRQKEAELYALQSQINPHFMYNTLESINMLAILDGNFQISDIITSFSAILRFNLDNTSQVISVQKELQYVSDYLNIQKVRYKNRLNVKIKKNANIDNLKILKLTIQPLVENAIYHGITQKDEEGNILISLERQEDNLIISVVDDGVGMSQDRLEEVIKSLEHEQALGKAGSIGLNNINERIKLYFGENYGLRIISKENQGTRVDMVIPACVLNEELD